MRIRAVRTLALALLLGNVGMIAAQQQGGPQGGARPGTPTSSKQKAPPEKSKLEEMLAESLKNNPDIRVAAAKMAEAEAELNRTRLQVTQKVVTLYFAIETQRKTVAHQESKYKRLMEMSKRSLIGPEDEAEGRQALALVKSKLEELEAQMPALLGKSAHSEANAEALRIWAGHSLRLIHEPQKPIEAYNYLLSPIAADPHKATGPMAERLRKALQTPVKVQYKNVSLPDVFKDLQKKVPGLSLRGTSLANQWGVNDLQFEEALPVSAILQALADDYGLRFIVREYGILATGPGDVPPGGLTVEDFLRHKPADESRPQSRERKNPPAENVEGLVKNVDASGLMTLTIGSDAGLAKGHTLELFRLNPSTPSQSRYLGAVRILEAEAHQSVAQPVGRLASPPQKGDRVASRIVGK